VLNVTRRILIGILFGGSTAAIVGLLIGIVAALVMGDRAIILMGPLEVESNFIAGFLGFSLFLFGAIAGAVAGAAVAAVNRPGAGWLIGMLTASVAESLLTSDMLSAASGALGGLIAGLVVERRLSREPEPPPGGQSVRQVLEASATSYSRPRLWFLLIVCLLPVLLGGYLLVAVDRLVGIILIVAFSLGAIYFACSLALKKN
jgi:hypothetical protein